MFKNLYPLQLSSKFSIPEDLEQKMQEKIFTKCGPNDKESVGWVSPFGKHSEVLTHTINGHILITMAVEEKILPASVVREAVEEAIELIEDSEARKVGSKEKREIRDNVEIDLLPQAFTRTKKTNAWIDTVNGWFIADTSSATVAESIAELLRTCLGSFPAVVPEAKGMPSELLTAWLRNDDMPEQFKLGDSCEIHGVAETKPVATFKKHDMEAESIHAAIDGGALVHNLGMSWANKLSFVFSEDLTFKKLSFIDLLAEQISENDAESKAEELDFQFALMTGEVSQMMTDLMPHFVNGGSDE